MYLRVFKLHSDLLKAMSHPKRLEIIHLLRDSEIPVHEIQEMLDLPQANLSQHLMVLRDAEIVKTKKEGKNIFYSIAHENFVRASDLIRQVLIEKQAGGKTNGDLTKKMSDLVPLTNDPVCKMKVSPKTASATYRLGDKTYYFCASGCLDKFKKNPERYAKNV